MRFQLLGPLSLTDGSDVVVLRPSKPTILLATLLLHANSVVSASYLQRTIWGPDQPATAKAALQTCVLRLRRLFTKHGVTETPIEAVPGGYRILAGSHTLDLIGFRERVREAAALTGDPEEELYSLQQALSLWQGSLLANVPSDVLHRDEVPRLTEERLRTVERACDLELSLGRFGQALVELWSATRSHPAHERFREQLIEALYRSGRQAEALAEYRGIKGYLLEELGVDPSPSLQKLELAILRGDTLGPEVAAVTPALTAGTGAGSAPGGRPAVAALPPAGEQAASAADARAVTSEVSEVPAFTGRSADVTAMAERLTRGGEGPVTLLVSGAPGIGKTALARHVAHLVRDHFPGGRLLVRMVHADGTPRAADEVSAEVAAACDARSAKPLLLLDDVVHADQVRPLLSAGGATAAIVTSRHWLAGLVATHGGWVHRLGTFDPRESYELLVAVLGATRVDAEPEAARQLADACGHYPLALRITTAWLLTRPGLRLADAAGWLAEDPLGRLALADDPRMSVERVLHAALERLDSRTAEAFLRLGALPLADPHGRGFHAADAEPVRADGAVAGAGTAELDRLADAGLLEDGPPGPYRMHALLRAYARFAGPPGTGAPRAAPDGTRPTQKV